MTREQALHDLMVANSYYPLDAIDVAIKSMEKLNKIEQIINDPLVKAFGSIGTNKIREILREEDKSCQMQ